MQSFDKPSREQRKEQMRKDIEERQEIWNKMTTMDKIKELDRRLGPNVGAKKQRARLKAQLEQEVKEKAVKKKKDKK